MEENKDAPQEQTTVRVRVEGSTAAEIEAAALEIAGRFFGGPAVLLPYAAQYNTPGSYWTFVTAQRAEEPPPDPGMTDPVS